MDKNTFCWILECALLNFDGLDYKTLISYGAEPEEANAGIKLCSYLKSIKTEKEEVKNV